MDKVFDAVYRADAAALVAHGRFLAEKFGHASGGGALALPPETVIGPDHRPQGRLQPPAVAGHAMSTGTGQVTSLADALRRWCRSPPAPGSRPTWRGPRAPRSPRRWPSRPPVHAADWASPSGADAPRTSSTRPSAVVAGARPRPRP